jgi:hypothetical protein
MSYILKAKHWQIFLLIVGLPILGDSTGLYSIQMVLIFLSASVLFGWLWSIENEISKLLIGLVSRTITFRVSFSLVILYFIVSIILLYSGISFESIYWLLLHFVCISLVFTIFYKCAKLIKYAELNREPEFSEVMSYFILIWFFPIGIWIIQPKLNRIIGEKS